jgi:uncharacterized protein
MRFEWDEIKNATNQRKHQLSFETAASVFDDPLHVSRADRIENGEQRWQTIGLVSGVAIVVVAHTWREADDDEVVRIISARKATRQERRNYENS